MPYKLQIPLGYIMVYVNYYKPIAQQKKIWESGKVNGPTSIEMNFAAIDVLSLGFPAPTVTPSFAGHLFIPLCGFDFRSHFSHWDDPPINQRVSSSVSAWLPDGCGATEAHGGSSCGRSGPPAMTGCISLDLQGTTMEHT